MEEGSDTYLQNNPGNEDRVEEEVKSDNVCVKYQRAFPQILKGSKSALEKASLSYRIAGDMDDKFWTGCLFTHLRADQYGSRETDLFHWDAMHEWFHGDRKIDQRKILEPFLVEKMVAELLKSTDEILKAIDDWLDPETVAPKDGNLSIEPQVSKADDRFVDVQYNRSAICLDLDATLRALRRLSEANVGTLGQWDKREQARNFKPRWSEKDEFKFRELIDFQKRRVDQQLARANDQHRRIQDSIEQIRIHRQEVSQGPEQAASKDGTNTLQLINNINLAESRTAAHESENIRIFTYATVIFYPLSFVAVCPCLLCIQAHTDCFNLEFVQYARPAVSYYPHTMRPEPDWSSNHTTTSLFLQATAIALVTTLLIVFNAETLAWPIRSFRYIISDSARRKMERTPNEFPVTWKKTLNHIKDAEEHNILHDHEMPKWPRTKLVYSLFLVVYFFFDFPASRVVLAYESVMNVKATFPDHATLIVVRILVALILLPVFAVSWMALVIWSLCSTILTGVWMLPLEKWKDIQEQHIQRHEKRLKEKYEADDEAKAKEKEKAEANEKAEAKAEAEVKERAREQEGARDGDRGKKNIKEEKQKTVKERIEETRRKERKAKEDRIQERVKLLINPPELFGRKEVNALRLRRKKKKREDEESQREGRTLD